jgi:hypothetical protein
MIFVAASPGAIMGPTIVTSVIQRLAPSSAAASSTSTGTWPLRFNQSNFIRMPPTDLLCAVRGIRVRAFGHYGSAVSGVDPSREPGAVPIRIRRVAFRVVAKHQSAKDEVYSSRNFKLCNEV